MRDVVIGIDVGGTRTKTVAVPVQGRGEHRCLLPGQVVDAVAPTPREIDVDPVGHLLASAISVLQPGQVPLAIGAVVPGLVDDEAGVAVWSANLGWRDVPLLVDLQTAAAAAGWPDAAISVGHDVRAGLLGEYAFGAARGVEDAVFVPLGTGVAAAVLSGGRVVSGSPWAGEIGHVVLDPTGPDCGCGARGCLEAMAGGAGLARRWQAAGGHGGVPGLVEAVRGGEQRALALWESAHGALSSVLAPVVAGIGARRVILGGGMAQAGDVLLSPVRAGFAQRLPGREVEVVAAVLGDRAAALGAAALAARSRRIDLGVKEETP